MKYEETSLSFHLQNCQLNPKSRYFVLQYLPLTKGKIILSPGQPLIIQKSLPKQKQHIRNRSFDWAIDLCLLSSVPCIFRLKYYLVKNPVLQPCLFSGRLNMSAMKTHNSELKTKNWGLTTWGTEKHWAMPPVPTVEDPPQLERCRLTSTTWGWKMPAWGKRCTIVFCIIAVEQL